jgi:hypothetical protein
MRTVGSDAMAPNLGTNCNGPEAMDIHTAVGYFGIHLYLMIHAPANYSGDIECRVAPP